MSQEEIKFVINTISNEVKKSLENNLGNYFTKFNNELSIIESLKNILYSLPEYNNLKKKYDKLLEEYKDLQNDYNMLKNNSENFIKENISLEIIDSIKNNSINIYTDGACKGNPGDGGWGAVIIIDNKEKRICGGVKNTTNNCMELLAAIKSLEYFDEKKSIKIYTDSKYVRDGITKWIISWKKNEWKTSQNKEVKNIELWKKLDELCNIHTVEWNWVKGHSNNYYNELADKLANDGIETLKLNEKYSEISEIEIEESEDEMISENESENHENNNFIDNEKELGDAPLYIQETCQLYLEKKREKESLNNKINEEVIEKGEEEAEEEEEEEEEEERRRRRSG